jgi:LCP family protein required for cell wall assembly
MHQRSRAFLTAALLFGVLLSACGSAAPSITPTPQPTPSPTPTPTPTAEPTPSPTPSPVPTPTPIPLDQSLLVRRVTVMVLGTDANDIRRAIRGFVENTDAMLVVSIDPRHEQITMLSLPRDAVDVPMADGRTWTAKINSLRGALGYQALEGALETLYGIPIDYYVEIDMADFGRLVNAVGGVDVVNSYGLYDPAIGLNLPAGPAHLNGNGAARYVRTRVDMDYSRARRQQEVFMALVEKFVDPALDLEPLAFLAGLRSLRTDIPLDKVPTFMELARRARDATVVGQVMGPPRFVRFEGYAGSRGWIMIPNIPEIRAFAQSAMGD